MKSGNTQLHALFILLLPFTVLSLFAQPNKQQWMGRWNISRDGLKGILIITDTKSDCNTTAWCDMAIRYEDVQGNGYIVRIARVDQNWQHMILYSNVPGTPERFDAYLFRKDPSTMAGIISVRNATSGFYATRGGTGNHPVVVHPPLTVAPVSTRGTSDSIVSRRILSGDTVETRYASGKIVWQTRGSTTTRYPNGSMSTQLAMEVPEYVPPTPISDPGVSKWLSLVETSLLDLIKEELLGDQDSVNSLVAYEKKHHLNGYQVVNNRFYFLDYLNRHK